MKIAAWFVAVIGALIAGCASNADPAAGGLYTRMSALDYAKLICSQVDLDDYATCVNGMLAVYEEPFEAEFPPVQTTSGPFMVLLDGDTYYGWYRSQPFVSDFRVSNDRTICRGGYNAFTGSVTPTFSVHCDDGRSGIADLVLDAGGRNGVGTITLGDGPAGRIVFGRGVLRGTPAAG
jgi:hypothetical protein